MIRSLVILLLLLFSISPLSGQYSFGISYGASLTTLKLNNVNPTFESKAMLNYYTGIFAKRSLAKDFSFLLEAGYSAKGYRYALEYSRTGDWRYKFNYITITPGLEYKAFDRISLNLSFYYSFLQSIKQASVHHERWHDYESGMSSRDKGFSLGIKWYGKNYFFRIAYDLGFQNLQDRPLHHFDGTPAPFAAKYNRAFHIGIGYFINCKSNE